MRIYRSISSLVFVSPIRHEETLCRCSSPYLTLLICSDPIVFSPPTASVRFDVTNSDGRNDTDHGAGETKTEKIFIDFLPHDVVDRARTYTFSNWPSINPSGKDMASAGWWYTNITDRVICPYCDAMFHNWVETDRPYEIHCRKSPQCPFVRAADRKTAMQARPVPVANSAATNSFTGPVAVGAIHAEYSMICRRHETFQKLAESDRASLPSTDSFVEAGFFYTGEKTTVRCFYCNGALRNWQLTDDPKVEHARWFPQCSYIRQYIGENLYEAIQRKNRELRGKWNPSIEREDLDHLFHRSSTELKWEYQRYPDKVHSMDQ